MHASTPLILRKSRMRRRASTDLCGGRSAMVVPTATVIHMPDKRLPEKSYIRECQETSLSVGSVPILFCLGIQPNWLNVHFHSERGLPQAESPVSSPRAKRRYASSSLWFHFTVVTAPVIF